MDIEKKYELCKVKQAGPGELGKMNILLKNKSEEKWYKVDPSIAQNALLVALDAITHKKEIGVIYSGDIIFGIGNIKKEFPESPLTIAFDKVVRDGQGIDFSGDKSLKFKECIGDINAHVQGVAIYNDFMILTHNCLNNDRGYIIIINTALPSKQIIQWTYTPEPDMNHPGGCQQSDGFLAVAIEKGKDQSGAYRSVVRLYSLRYLSCAGLPGLLLAKIPRETQAGAVGITSRVEGGTKFYYIGVYNWGTVDFYKSNGKALDSPDCTFELSFSENPAQEADNINLFTEEESGNIFMIGFKGVGNLTSFEDWAYLYRVNLEKTANAHLSLIKSYKFTTHGDGIGFLGAHFRYGAGADLTGGKFAFWSAGRNIIGDNIKGYCIIANKFGSVS